MATRKVKCTCGVKLAVSFQAQAVSCPVCRTVTILRPANGGYAVPAANQYNNQGNYPISAYNGNQQSLRLPQKVSPVLVYGNKSNYPTSDYSSAQLPLRLPQQVLSVLAHGNKSNYQTSDYSSNQEPQRLPQQVSPVSVHGNKSNYPTSAYNSNQEPLRLPQQVSPESVNGNKSNYPTSAYNSNQQPLRLPQQVSPVSVHGNKTNYPTSDYNINQQPQRLPQQVSPLSVHKSNYPSSAYSSNQQSLRLPQQVSPVSMHGNKRALLCGVSYNGQDTYLKGSVNDVNSMKCFLIQRMGFPHQSICVLTEDEKEPTRIPTKHNIREAMKWLVKGCQSGDSLVFHYSGHAARVRDRDGDEVDGFDETLCPVDYQIEGKILDDEINATLVRPLPHGAKLHAIIDTCFSGTFLDLPFMCKMNRQGYHMWEDHRVPSIYKGTKGGMAICFSACDDNESSGDTTAFTGGKATGAMTYSFINVLEKEPSLSYGSLLSAIRNKILEAQTRVKSSTPQVPQLSSSEQFDIHSMTFML